MSDSNLYRTHVCGELRPRDVDTRVTLVGFVDGSLMEGKAIDLRDRTGAMGCLLPEKPEQKMLDLWAQVSPEAVVQVAGKVMTRKKRDPELATGEVFLMIEKLTLLSPAEALPVELIVAALGEEDRFRYRMLHLRRAPMQERLAFRSKWLLEARKHLAEQNFIEVETPLLAPPGLEPASSFLIPVKNGKGYQLPSSPQQYKQALIAGGVERYFQVARCFRNDEDATPERQPEFSVLDAELAWVDETALLATTEKLLVTTMKKAMNVEVKLPIERIPYAVAMEKFGTDKPDLRARMEIFDATGTLKSLGGADAVAMLGDGAARAIRVDGGVERLGDAELDQLTATMNRAGTARTSWLKFGAQTGIRGPGARLFGSRAPDALAASNVKQGDALVLSIAREPAQAQKTAGALRTQLVRMIGDKDTSTFAFAFITELPFFAFDEAEKVWVPKRHPFTQPRDEDLALIEHEERKHSARAKAFTLVANGVEIGAGGMRNHDLVLQDKIFKMFGLRNVDIQKRYEKVLDNFRYGAPPHGGFTLQLDRTMALLQGAAGIDDVMAFPKSMDCRDLMFETPSTVDAQAVRTRLE